MKTLNNTRRIDALTLFTWRWGPTPSACHRSPSARGVGYKPFAAGRTFLGPWPHSPRVHDSPSARRDDSTRLSARSTLAAVVGRPCQGRRFAGLKGQPTTDGTTREPHS